MMRMPAAGPKPDIIVVSAVFLCLMSGCAGMGWKAEGQLEKLRATSCFVGEQQASNSRPGKSLPNNQIYLAESGYGRTWDSAGTTDGTDGYPKPNHSGGGGDGLLLLIPLGIAIIGAGAAIMTPDLTDFLTEQGPQLQPTFTMNSLVVTGLVQGNWPVVLDFQADQDTSLLIEVCTADDEPYRVRIDATKTGRRWQKLTLPAQFGDEPKPGAIKILAEGGRQNISDEPVPFQLFGVGAGPRAVGSVAIDQLEFRLFDNQKGAFYRYFAHQPFNTVSPEILRYKREPEGIGVERIWWRDQDHFIQGISPGMQPLAEWDCREAQPYPAHLGQVSIGPHLLQVRGWFGPKDTDKSWVAAWSENVVVVPPEWGLTSK